MSDTPDIPRSANILVDMILGSPATLAALKEKPEETLRQAAAVATKNLPPPPLVREAGIYYIVVGSLGFVACAAALGAIYLSSGVPAGTEAKIPELLTALGSAAIGALAGLLVPSPTRGQS